MDTILNHIRSLIFGVPLFNRKRRAADEFENPVTTKIRRISNSQMSSPEDDWVSTASSNSIKRRNILLPKKLTPRQRLSWSRNNYSIPVDDDDDDDVVEVKKPIEFECLRNKSSLKTSTPNCSGHKSPQNGEDDVTFVKYISPDEKKLSAKKQGFDYIRPTFNLQNGTSSGRLSNGTKKKDPVFYGLNKENSGKSASAMQQTRKYSSTATLAADQSFRLDEKRKYKELLNKVAPTARAKTLMDSFAEYSTPVGKIFSMGGFGSRGKKLVDMATKTNDKKISAVIDLTRNGNNNKGKVCDFIDLTATANDKPKTRTSIGTTIEKILSDMDNDVASKRSEVEVLPTPPSPKPDVKVERSNSLKSAVVDPSEPMHNKWFSNVIKRHDDVIARTQKLIDEQALNLEKTSSINDKIRLKLLQDKVSVCLRIKDVVVPDIPVAEEVFPELTPKQEAKISNALDGRKPGSEILARQFNMNITRQDLLTLSGLNWLNDEVINFYMNLIIERGKQDKWPSAYAMNTFFYPKILSGGQSSVRRWTRKVDIFSYDLIAVPIHLRMHWCMALIDFRKRKIEYYDSMGSSNMECLRSLLTYLEDEHLDKKKTEYDVSDWRLTNAKDIPQQMNGSDCGMFACTFAEVLTRDAEINFSQENMPYLRRKMVLEILESRLLIS